MSDQDKWAHAQSAENIVERKSRKAELDLMRDLFNDRLPVGDDLDVINKYLDDVEQIIEKNGTIHNEDFPEERELIDPETGKPVPYRYYAPSILKQRASQRLGTDRSAFEGVHKCITNSQDMDPTPPTRRRKSISSESEKLEHLSHMEVGDIPEDLAPPVLRRSKSGGNNNHSFW